MLMESPYPDLRSFLDELRRDFPERLLTLSEPISTRFLTTALTMEMETLKNPPVLYLPNIEGRNQRMVSNLFASRELMAYSIGATPQNFYERFGTCLDHLLPAQKVENAPVQEIIWTGAEADLTRLPVPLHFAQDAGPYITAGMTAARDPETGVGNLSYARLQVKGPQRMGASLHSRQHLWDYQRRAEQMGQDLPVCVVLGGHPALMIAAAAKMGIDQDEYDLAGALLNQPLPLVRARTVDVDVPANAEIVIEGYLKANLHEPEGPFGEYTGFSTDRSTQNVLEVTAITMRRDPIFVDLVPGNSREHLNLGRASKEAWVFKRMKEALPFFLGFYYPPSGTHFHCYVRIHKTAEGQAQQAALLLMGLDHYIKLVVVVDEDIDPAQEEQVLWAMATSTQADRDVSIIPHVMCNQLDPSSQDGMGAKMLVDATRPLQTTAKRISIPDEAVAEARRILAAARA
jgi:2,5-furandicarboxylate decarboxylase 1